jgi:hypothetical protein
MSNHPMPGNFNAGRDIKAEHGPEKIDLEAFKLGHVSTGTKILELAPYEVSVRPICIGGECAWRVPRGGGLFSLRHDPAAQSVERRCPNGRLVAATGIGC